MALSPEMSGILEMLLKTLLARRESFQAIFTQMKPIVHYEDEFFVAFFLGYIAHSYKQVFSILTNTDMKHDEIVSVLEFLMRSEPMIREGFQNLGQSMNLELQQAVQDEPIARIMKSVEGELVRKIMSVEDGVHRVRNDINLIKHVASEDIKKYESILARSGKFAKSILK
jgi:hypothetical protein